MLVTSVANCFANLISSATIASSKPMKKGASNQRLRNTQCSRVASNLLMRSALVPGLRFRFGRDGEPCVPDARTETVNPAPLASATILHRAAASLFDREDLGGACRSVRVGGVDVDRSIAAGLFRAVQRLVGALDQSGEAAFR